MRPRSSGRVGERCSMRRHLFLVRTKNLLVDRTKLRWRAAVQPTVTTKRYGLFFIAVVCCSVALGFAPSKKRCVRLALGASLDCLTVKELRQLVKESVNQRGVLSKLKRKQDLIDFLEKRPPIKQLESRPSSSSGLATERRTPLGMPRSELIINSKASVNRRILSDDDPYEEPSADLVVDDALREEQTKHEFTNFSRNTTGASRSNHAPSSATVDDSPLTDTLHIGSSDMKTSTTTRSARGAFLERVYERYPPIRDAPYTNYASPTDDVRQLYHPIYSTIKRTSDMELIFVGTASCTPGLTRGVSCTALRLNWRRKSSIWNHEKQHLENVDGFQGGTWIFDVGECTQLQIQRTPSIRASKITKIFLTHAHGDHSFGLPGLLCLMGQDRDRDSPPVEIYGPEGLRMWLRVAIRYSVSRIVPPYRVHEIMDVPMAPEWELSPRRRRYFYRGLASTTEKSWCMKGLIGEDSESWISLATKIAVKRSPLYGEIEGGRDIYPMYDHPKSFDGAPVWEVEDEEDVKVFAAPMSHSIPCVGYVVDEQPRAGRLRNELVEPIVRRNVDALRNAGFNVPMKAMAVIKNLSPGSAFTFPDGTVVAQEEAVEPPKQGRKVVICGDTCNSRALYGLADRADVVVHESTNCFIPGIDKDTSLKLVTKDAMLHGHSTPQIAGHFAKQVEARRLILNHFSARYKGDTAADSLSIMMRIENYAMLASGLDESRVAAAWDLMVLPILSN